MDAPYERTSLWRRTLALRSPDPNATARERLRAAFRNFRDRAGVLANEIAVSYPSLTVHGVEHLDALWDAADLIAGKKYPISPAEAFVLGGAFLVHDLGNGLAAYPEGLASLERTQEWRDAVALIIRRTESRVPTDDDLAAPAPPVRQLALEGTLRALHARRAAVLVSEVAFRDSEGRTLHLLDDSDLVATYGRIIGIIAQSHWWNADELASLQNEDLGPPTWCAADDWSVDALKVACLMRAADAAQIDARRAPAFLGAVRRPGGTASLHWNFQGHLATHPRLHHGALAYSSTRSFGPGEVDAWWLAYEYLTLVDRELRAVDTLLRERENAHRPRLAAQGVCGVESPERFAAYLRCEGWSPVDARIHISDVPAVIERLGGKQLYGKDSWIPLRELIQNAADAVRARREVDPGWSASRGRILARLGSDRFGEFCEVSDDGIGMSAAVLTQILLNFGRSLWTTDVVTREWPGLLATRFRPTGAFGIGFFSVFMWGKRVRVVTRRFDRGWSDERVLEFSEGLAGRPILRPSRDDERLSTSGTCVRVWFDGGHAPPDLLVEEDDSRYRTSRMSFIERCGWVAPALDVDLFVQMDAAETQLAVARGDWASMESDTLLTRLYGARFARDHHASLELEPNSGGRLGILMHQATNGWGELIRTWGSRWGDIVSVVGVNGGLRGSQVEMNAPVVGLVEVVPPNATRLGIVIQDLPTTPQWATTQACRCVSAGCLDEHLADTVLALGGWPGGLTVAWRQRIGAYNMRVSFDELCKAARESSELNFYLGDLTKHDRYETSEDRDSGGARAWGLPIPDGVLVIEGVGDCTLDTERVRGELSQESLPWLIAIAAAWNTTVTALCESAVLALHTTYWSGEDYYYTWRATFARDSRRDGAAAPEPDPNHSPSHSA